MLINNHLLGVNQLKMTNKNIKIMDYNLGKIFCYMKPNSC